MAATPVLFALFALISLAHAQSVSNDQVKPLGWPEAKVISLSLQNSSGVWFGLGDQHTQAVWDAYDVANGFPNCSKHQGEFNYEHYAADDPHYTFVYYDKKTGKATTFAAGHKRTSESRILKADGYILTKQAVATGVISCQFWKPYIDLRTGEVKVQTINKNEWERHSNGTVTRTSLNCMVKETEVPGCYPQGANKVHAVSVATYVCQNGECLSFAPKSQTHEDH